MRTMNKNQHTRQSRGTAGVVVVNQWRWPFGDASTTRFRLRDASQFMPRARRDSFPGNTLSDIHDAFRYRPCMVVDSPVASGAEESADARDSSTAADIGKRHEVQSLLQSMRRIPAAFGRIAGNAQSMHGNVGFLLQLAATSGDTEPRSAISARRSTMNLVCGAAA